MALKAKRLEKIIKGVSIDRDKKTKRSLRAESWALQPREVRKVGRGSRGDCAGAAGAGEEIPTKCGIQKPAEESIFRRRASPTALHATERPSKVKTEDSLD